MSTQTCLYTLTMNIKKTVNVSAPSKAHDRPLLQGSNRAWGSDYRGAPLSCFGKHWIKFLWKCRSPLCITITTDYSTQQQSYKFSFKTDDLSFRFLFWFLLSWPTFFLCIAALLFVRTLYIMFLSQDESGKQEGFSLSCRGCCMLCQTQLSRRGGKRLTPLWEHMEIFRGQCFRMQVEVGRGTSKNIWAWETAEQSKSKVISPGWQKDCVGLVCYSPRSQ